MILSSTGILMKIVSTGIYFTVIATGFFHVILNISGIPFVYKTTHISIGKWIYVSLIT